jgi:hypothetical protein
MTRSLGIWGVCGALMVGVAATTSCATSIDDLFQGTGGFGGEGTDASSARTATVTANGSGQTTSTTKASTTQGPSSTSPATTVAPVSQTAAPSTSTGVPLCNGDLQCALPDGELCGLCSDCQVGTANCGACVADGVCTQEDACTCDDCATDMQCTSLACTNDGICDFFIEGCSCADCAITPNCI